MLVMDGTDGMAGAPVGPLAVGCRSGGMKVTTVGDMNQQQLEI